MATSEGPEQAVWRSVRFAFFLPALGGGTLALVGGLGPWFPHSFSRVTLTALGTVVGVAVAVPLAVRWVQAIVYRAVRRGEVVRIPTLLSTRFAAVWLSGAAVASVAFAVTDPSHPATAVQTFLWTGLSGVVAGAATYFFVEQSLRPHFAEAFRAGRATTTSAPGIRGRILLLWAAGAAAPIMAMTVIAFSRVPRHDIATSEWIIASVAIVGGALLSVAVARTIVVPLDRVRAVLHRVEVGDLDAETEVDDAGEVGQLQAGVNSMVHGLRERQALHTALGAYVDENVARRILDEGVLLEGEEVDVTVMFLDLRNFTAFCEDTPSREIVARLNELWAIVIPLLHENGGHANKFVGDAVLGVFGAPLAVQDHADRALRAATQIRSEVERKLRGDVRIGIGINSGPVLAGTLGGGGRLEFTVIGDVVNVAARVQDLTKQIGDPILVTSATRSRLQLHESELLPRGETMIRGKQTPVELFALACEGFDGR